MMARRGSVVSVGRMPEIRPARRMANVVEGLARDFATEHGLTDLGLYDLFETFTAYCIVKQYNREFDPDDLRSGGSRAGGANDLGIDAYAVIINGRLFTDPDDVRSYVSQHVQLEVRFVVVQAKRRVAFEGEAFTKLANGVVRLFSHGELTGRTNKGTTKLRECAHAVYADVAKFAVHGLPRIDAWVATLGHYRAKSWRSVQDLARERLEQSGLFRFVEVRGAGAQQLRDSYRNEAATTSVKFSLPAAKRIEMKSSPGIPRALVGVVSARELVDQMLLDEQGIRRPHLFDENLRDFLGTVKYPVNAEIQATLRDTTRRSQFAMLNNGITIVADVITADPRNVHLRGPQIVNGCQTCYVLLDNREQLTSDVMVNVRIIQSQDEQVVASIVRATNRQTAINEDDLSAGEAFQRHLEEYFATRDAGTEIFYQRRVQQYGSSKIRAKVINRRHLTQAYAASWLGIPERVTRYVGVVKEFDRELFGDEHDPLPYYVSAAAYLNLDRLLGGKGIPAAYRPARFHLLYGLRLLAAGTIPPQPASGQPTSPELEKACGRLVEVIWDRDELVTVAGSLLTVVDRLTHGGSLSGLEGLVRSPRFTAEFERAVLELPSLT